MQIEVIPQIELGNVSRLRVGDFLNKAIADDICQQFRFAVAYMRMSGLDRLGASIDALLNRGGHVSGAVGVDAEITSIEALEALSQISSDSTIFYTISGFIYHPKLYLMSSDRQAIAVVGSPNLTSDGLFRNIELATAINLNFDDSMDLEVYRKFDAFISELLDITHPNVQPIDTATIEALARADLIKNESRTKEPGPPIRPKKKSSLAADLESLFPPLQVPVAPPILERVRSRISPPPSLVVPAVTEKPVSTFIMQLSPFDSSHRSGTSGTPEVLIPQAAINFFPPLTSSSGRVHPDAYFNAILNTRTGRERHGYRFWFYSARTEWRLRLDHATIDLSTPNGGDLLVINKLPEGGIDNLLYEVTILSQTDPNFDAFMSQCKYEAQGKKWGIINA